MLWIETDLEPDDVLAIRLLPIANYYVVGEGDAAIKSRRMTAYLSLLQNLQKGSGLNTPTRIIQGLPSKKKFADDGKEFDSLPPYDESHVYLDEFKAFAVGDSPIMFSLKPMRELLAEYHKDPDGIAKLVSNVTLYVYGGFNFRSLLYEYEKELLALLSHFRQVNIYESFYVTGDQNSVSAKNMSRFYQWTVNHRAEPFTTILLRLTRLWNAHLLTEMIESLERDNRRSSGDDKAILRRKKVIDSIQDNIDFQYVLADFGLALIYRDVQPMPIKNLHFVNGYTTFEQGEPPSTIRIYRNVGFEELETRLVAQLDK